MILQFLHIFFTDARTFINNSKLAYHNTPGSLAPRKLDFFIKDSY